MTGGNDSDEDLMRRVKLGDRDAYERLYGRWRQRVYAFLVRRTGTVATADDALQETWLRVYRSSGTFDPGRSFKSWLFTIAAHAGVDAGRSDREVFELEPEGDEPHALRDLLVGALDSLGADDRRLLLLAIEGFDSAEIGEMLAIQPGAVRVRLHRARQRVRTALGAPDA